MKKHTVTRLPDGSFEVNGIVLHYEDVAQQFADELNAEAREERKQSRIAAILDAIWLAIFFS